MSLQKLMKFFTGTAAEVMNILSLDDYSFKSDELTKILKSITFKRKKEILLTDFLFYLHVEFENILNLTNFYRKLS